MNRFIVLGFDMETDIGSYLKSYNGVQAGTRKILDILHRHDITATFFFTGDAAENNPQILQEVARAGHEIGCHSLKHETVGDAHFNMPNDSSILEQELQYRLQLNRQLVQDLCGILPVSYRAPRLWQGDAQVRVLEALGFLVDASYSVAVHRNMVVPYHPSRTSWLKAGDLRLLEMPNFAFREDPRRFRRYFGNNDQWPLLRLIGADFVIKHLEELVAEQVAAASSACFLFYLHPWEFERMPAKYRYDEGTFCFRPELHKNCGPRMVSEFARFVEKALDAGYNFTTCAGYREFYERGQG